VISGTRSNGDSVASVSAVIKHVIAQNRPAAHGWNAMETTMKITRSRCQGRGPGGAGHKVCISGFEKWRIGSDGLIASSHGHFDSAEYRRQLEQGI
jgi:hypothetical protein